MGCQPRNHSVKLCESTSFPDLMFQVIAKHVPADKFKRHTRVVYLPGFTTTVKQELDALVEVEGKEALKLLDFKVSLQA